MCVSAGAALFGLNFLADLSGLYDCHYDLHDCTLTTVLFCLLVIGPILTGAVILGVKYSASIWACLGLGLAAAVAMDAWIILSAELNLDHDYIGNNDVFEAWLHAQLLPFLVVPVVALGTGVLGWLLRLRRPPVIGIAALESP